MKTFKAIVTITLRQGILDVQGKTVEHALHSMGFGSMGHVRIGKHVELELTSESEHDARKQLDEACRSLIANPIMEDYTIELTEAQ